MEIIGVLIVLGVVIELKFSPRIDLIKEEEYTDVVLWYNIKSKFGEVNIREYLWLYRKLN